MNDDHRIYVRITRWVKGVQVQQRTLIYNSGKPIDLETLMNPIDKAITPLGAVRRKKTVLGKLFRQNYKPERKR